MSTIGIIGAGPAGVVAALEASKRGNKTILIDSNPRIGRKLLVTGSGRCNITNKNAAAQKYHGVSSEILNPILNRITPADLITYLGQLGIPIYSTDDGWCYPRSNSAANVVDIFEAHLKQSGVQIALSTTVEDIHLNEHRKFLIKTTQSRNQIEVDALIVASGGKAYPNLGSTGALFTTLERLGHTVNPVLPALAPILTDKKKISGLQGIRLDADLKLVTGTRLLDRTRGNIIFTDWGLNGPGVMDLSYLVSQNENNDLALEIDFLSGDIQNIDLNRKKKAFSQFPIKILFEAILPSKLVHILLSKSGISADEKISTIRQNQFSELIKLFTQFTIRVIGTRGFEFSQLSMGGIPFSEINPTTMASNIVPGLYLAGEVLDIIGPCGGYNLHWAFISGIIAGKSVRTLEPEKE